MCLETLLVITDCLPVCLTHSHLYFLYHNPQIPNLLHEILHNVQGLHWLCGTSEIEHGLCACTVDNPLAKARGLSLRSGAQTLIYLPHVALKFIFCRRWQAVYASLCSHTPVCDYSALQHLVVCRQNNNNNRNDKNSNNNK